MHVLEHSLHSTEKRQDRKWNKTNSLQGWGSKDRREIGPKVGKKGNKPQMFNPERQGSFILKCFHTY